MKKTIFACAALCAWTAAAAVRFAPQQLPRSDFADTEVATNLAFSAGSVRDNLWTLTLEVDAADANCALAEFGIDADGDGELGRDETELAIGWDCGEWVVRDRRGGACRRSVATTPPEAKKRPGIRPWCRPEPPKTASRKKVSTCS